LRFSYYQRLSRAEQAIYRRSDDIHAVRLGANQQPLVELAAAVERALAGGQPPIIEGTCAALCRMLTERLGVPPVVVRVLAVRPSDAGSELHGLYTAGDGKPPTIRVWMRTAAHRRVVAFKAFLRTLLHELCHHLDFELYRLPESFHTQGFFKRESSLFHQLVPRSTARPRIT